MTREFVPDRRGNRLEHHEFLGVPGGRRHRLRLRGSAEIAGQFCQDRSDWCSYRPVLELSGGGDWWTHSLEGAGPGPDLACAQLVDLLAEVLTLPQLPGADIALALDWYKISWRDTIAGRLVAAGTYRTSQAEAVGAAATTLASHLAGVIARHPLLGSADVIAPAPGHDRSMLSFGEWVGRETAAALGMPAVNVATRHGFRPPARDVPSGDRLLADGEFFFREDLADRTVLVIDDICQTGQTAAATAQAARRAGAAGVYVLAGARTRRR